MMITAEQVRELLDYDQETGLFTWRVNNIGKARSGAVAGSRQPGSYTQIGIMGRLYLAHRIAWLHVHGVFPQGNIDHVNGEKDDNRIENLREANKSQNAANSCVRKNNTTGFKGVSINGRARRFRAKIESHGETIHLGYFDTPEEASAAYCRAAENLHGEFANGGSA